MKSNFFSPGKLLITSEYFVLDGALALAVPTKLGQELSCREFSDEKSIVVWETFVKSEPWFYLELDYKNWQIKTTNQLAKAEFIIKVLKNIQNLSSKVLQDNTSYHLVFNIQFSADYGLGSSSTMINNLSDWAEIDAFMLNEISLGGSGYDIAVAKEKSVILYQNNPKFIEKIDFKPDFVDELILIYLNKKQDSREAINLYKSKNKSSELISEFSDITKKVLQSKNIEEFSELIEIHEDKLSHFLGIKKVKDKYFKDCPSFVKSLGAWGGDFVLASKFGDYKNYFSDRNYTDIFSWKDLII